MPINAEDTSPSVSIRIVGTNAIIAGETKLAGDGTTRLYVINYDVTSDTFPAIPRTYTFTTPSAMIAK